MEKRSLLHIDDNPTFRDNLQQHLANQGFKVHSCATSKDALAFAPSVDYQAIVTDSSGLSFAEDIKRRYPAIRLIVLSAGLNSPGVVADKWITKGGDEGWMGQVEQAVSDQGPTNGDVGTPLAVSQRLNAFASLTPEQLDAYRGKILVLAGRPEILIGASDTIEEAERLAKETPGKQMCCLVQGPPLHPVTLAELEGY